MSRVSQRSEPLFTPDRPVRLFVSYSHHDDEARKRLDTHMAQLKREGIEVWFDGDIVPGAELEPAIRRKLRAADIFVALASPDYLHSRYCYEIEYGYAIRKAGRKAIHVVVAVLKACQWRRTRMARYKLLPKDGKPVDQWARRADAYEDIVEGIRTIVRTVRSERNSQTVRGEPGASRRRAVRTAPQSGLPKGSSANKPAKPSMASPSGKPKAARKPKRPLVSKGGSVKIKRPVRGRGNKERLATRR